MSIRQAYENPPVNKILRILLDCLAAQSALRLRDVFHQVVLYKTEKKDRNVFSGTSLDRDGAQR